MRERLRLIDGTLHFNSSAHGTLVAAVVPVAESAVSRPNCDIPHWNRALHRGLRNNSIGLTTSSDRQRSVQSCIYRDGTKSNGAVASIWLKIVFEDEPVVCVALRPVSEYSVALPFPPTSATGTVSEMTPPFLRSLVAPLHCVCVWVRSERNPGCCPMSAFLRRRNSVVDHYLTPSLQNRYDQRQRGSDQVCL